MAELQLILENEPYEGILILEQFSELNGGGTPGSGEGIDEAGLKAFLEHNNSLTELYVGNYTFAQRVASSLPIASATVLGAIRVGSNLSIDANGVLNATGGGEGGSGVWGSISGTISDQADLMALLNWFQVVNPGTENEYLRVLLPIAGDKEIQAWTDSGQFPGTIWESMPLATAEAIGGIQLGESNTRYLREDGTWQTIEISGSVNTIGTPSDNQVAVFTGATTIEGHSGFTYSSLTGTLDVATIARANGSLRHLNLKAGDAYGGTGTDAGHVYIKGGNALSGDATSVCGAVFLKPGNAYASNVLSYIYLGDGTFNGEQIRIQAEGTLSNISVSLRPKGSGNVYIGNTGTNYIYGRVIANNNIEALAFAATASFSFINSYGYDFNYIMGADGIEARPNGIPLAIYGGNGYATLNGNGGDLCIMGGVGYGTGTAGKIYLGTRERGALTARTN